jgi:hypothetical protein
LRLKTPSAAVRHPSRSGAGALTRGLSWPDRLVQVGGLLQPRNKENAP